ncbi:MAG: four helix bundle protein, partial [Vicinamibacterales bacterium]
PLSVRDRKDCDASRWLPSNQAQYTLLTTGLRLAARRGMAGFRRFEDIEAWQLATELKQLADALLAKPEVTHRLKFCDQLSDSARSGPRNIAEGFARFKHKEFAYFVRIAKGSESEVLNHFIDAREQQLLSDQEFSQVESIAKRAMGAATGLIRFLESTPDPPWPKRKPRST